MESENKKQKCGAAMDPLIAKKQQVVISLKKAIAGCRESSYLEQDLQLCDLLKEIGMLNYQLRNDYITIFQWAQKGKIAQCLERLDFFNGQQVYKITMLLLYFEVQNCKNTPQYRNHIAQIFDKFTQLVNTNLQLRWSNFFSGYFMEWWAKEVAAFIPAGFLARFFDYEDASLTKHQGDQILQRIAVDLATQKNFTQAVAIAQEMIYRANINTTLQGIVASAIKQGEKIVALETIKKIDISEHYNNAIVRFIDKYSTDKEAMEKLEEAIYDYQEDLNPLLETMVLELAKKRQIDYCLKILSDMEKFPAISTIQEVLLALHECNKENKKDICRHLYEQVQKQTNHVSQTCILELINILGSTKPEQEIFDRAMTNIRKINHEQDRVEAMVNLVQLYINIKENERALEVAAHVQIESEIFFYGLDYFPKTLFLIVKSFAKRKEWQDCLANLKKIEDHDLRAASLHCILENGPQDDELTLELLEEVSSIKRISVWQDFAVHVKERSTDKELFFDELLKAADKINNSEQIFPDLAPHIIPYKFDYGKKILTKVENKNSRSQILKILIDTATHAKNLNQLRKISTELKTLGHYATVTTGYYAAALASLGNKIEAGKIFSPLLLQSLDFSGDLLELAKLLNQPPDIPIDKGFWSNILKKAKDLNSKSILVATVVNKGEPILSFIDYIFPKDPMKKLWSIPNINKSKHISLFFTHILKSLAESKESLIDESAFLYFVETKRKQNQQLSLPLWQQCIEITQSFSSEYSKVQLLAISAQNLLLYEKKEEALEHFSQALKLVNQISGSYNRNSALALIIECIVESQLQKSLFDEITTCISEVESYEEKCDIVSRVYKSMFKRGKKDQLVSLFSHIKESLPQGNSIELTPLRAWLGEDISTLNNDHDYDNYDCYRNYIILMHAFIWQNKLDKVNDILKEIQEIDDEFSTASYEFVGEFVSKGDMENAVKYLRCYDDDSIWEVESAINLIAKWEKGNKKRKFAHKIKNIIYKNDSQYDRMKLLPKLALVFIDNGDIKVANGIMTKMQECMEEVKDSGSAANFLREMAAAWWALGKKEQALFYCEQALELFLEMTEENNKINCIQKIANALAQYGDRKILPDYLKKQNLTTTYRQNAVKGWQQGIVDFSDNPWVDLRNSLTLFPFCYETINHSIKMLLLLYLKNDQQDEYEKIIAYV